ncbi:MAG: class I SAM-dependent methyltransferase [Planctomycetota bacterium]|jgi:ubiquinone/menaquinone biosynthesis C-methylase UbiE
MSQQVTGQTRQVYDDYYRKKGRLRNSLFANPEVLWQAVAADASIIRAFSATKVDPDQATIFYAGCGSGGHIYNFLRLGFRPANIHAVDILEDRVAEAQHRHPNINIFVGDAQKLDYPDGCFDIVFESTMFLQMTDDDLAGRIAREMLRLCKPGGFVIVSDWRYSKPGDKSYKGVSNKRLKKLFDVGKQCEVAGRFAGTMVPPAGRFFSKYLPSLYFVVRKVFPFLAGHRTVLLRKTT